ncbi:hypothetical protein O7630_34615 [Micromonospora sp. WMMD718]|uniref:hypothetical protein n=1 Tax=Micromonospora sp. WMMD718 TaxID=3016098 RepID=UPI0024160A48|nr:hypothetical protein [Micromonospora sp. WMMD718]MDG4749338.1 hypothetical protein [Micromonospora sp. WMMD718]MDG4756080.1 hypothetical protein [Micromonospora sp. WMMD718]
MLAVMGWTDDRQDIVAPGLLWELAEEIIRAADGASSEAHVIEFRADGWTIQHPLSCRPNLFACRVNRAAERDLANIDRPPFLGRYECAANDLGDRLHIGDRVDQEDARADG